MTSRDPRPLQDALAAVTRELGIPDASAFATLTETWLAVAGEDVVRHARVRAVRNGECTIEVDGPAWATRVRYLASDFERLASTRGGAAFVTHTKVVVKGP